MGQHKRNKAVLRAMATLEMQIRRAKQEHDRYEDGRSVLAWLTLSRLARGLFSQRLDQIFAGSREPNRQRSEFELQLIELQQQCADYEVSITLHSARQRQRTTGE